MGRFSVKSENIFEALRFSESLHEGVPVTLVLHILKRPKRANKRNGRPREPERSGNAQSTARVESREASVAFETSKTEKCLVKQESVGFYEETFEQDLESLARSVDVTPSKPLLRDVRAATSGLDELDDALDQLNQLAMIGSEGTDA